MPENHDTTRFDLRVNPQDPSTWLKPGAKLIGADGRDWSWTYVVYREVPGNPAYCAGTNGSVWSRKKRLGSAGGRRGSSFILGDAWRRLKPMPHQNGYLFVVLSDGTPSSRVPRSVHCVVMKTFVGPPPDGKEVRHLNGKSPDNRLSNLWYGTKAENQADRIRHGTDGRGERGGLAKLTNANVIEIRRLYEAGAKQVHLANQYGITQANVSAIVRRKTWTHI